MATNEPMTNERLSEIRARVKNTWKIQAVGPANMGDLESWQLQSIAVAYVDDVADLLDEVDRLRADTQAVMTAHKALAQEIRRLAAETDENAAAIDELEWQRGMNQQLSAENEQKQAQIDAMRPIVEAVAWGGDAQDFSARAMYALNYHVYASDEMRKRALAFVAAHPATDTAGE